MVATDEKFRGAVRPPEGDEMRARIALCLWLSWSTMSVAVEKTVPDGKDSRGPLLVSIRNGKNLFAEVKPGGKLLPRRIYAVYFADLGLRVFLLTKADGSFAHPREVFLTGSTIQSKYVGVPGGKLYRLSLAQRWEVTDEKEERHRLEVTRVDGTVFNRHRTADPGDEG